MNHFFSIAKKITFGKLICQNCICVSGLCFIALGTLQSFFCVARYEMGRVWEHYLYKHQVCYVPYLALDLSLPTSAVGPVQRALGDPA